MDGTLNVVDRYKSWTVDAIREDVEKHTFPYAVCMVNIDYDYNLGCLVRNANFFGAKEVYYLQDRKKWDVRSSVGARHYTKTTHLKDIHELLDLHYDPRGPQYNLVAIENNIPNTKPLNEFVWPDNPLVLFGSEGYGLDADILRHCHSVVEIPGYGSIRSLNVGTASGIIMNDFVRKHEMVC